jgi:hypothetical protein
MVRFWDVVLVLFIIFMKIDLVEAQKECLTNWDCSSCLSQSGCAFVWDYSGKGTCIEESNEDEVDFLKIARFEVDCPLSGGKSENPSDFVVSGIDAGVAPTFIEGMQSWKSNSA